MNRSRLGHEKAAWAVDRARAHLQYLGYIVPVPSGVCVQGADLNIYKSQFPKAKKFTVEVKLAMWNKRAWRVNRVTRIHDDYIAIVFPSGHVQLEAMGDHLTLCSGSGDRYLTSLGRLFE